MTATDPEPETDLSPRIAGPDGDPAGGTGTRSGDGTTTGPDPADPVGLPPELGLGQLVPSADLAAPAPASRPAAAPTVDDAGLPGGPFGRRTPMVAGMLVGLAALAGGSGWLWWRSRDSRYWPA